MHLSTEEKAQKFFEPHGLADLPQIADEEGGLYQTFGLERANWRQYLNFESILRMLIAWLKGHWAGLPAGDEQQMPGVFLIVDGQIRKAYRHKLVSDRPDYLQLATAS